jgi:maltose alpha-D-glucosyltransferase/alpha-amylase
MQWTSDRNGGFSRCDPARLYLPVIMDPVYGHQSVNVEAQQRSPSSLLNWMKRVIGVRRSSQAFSRGTLTFLRPSNRTVLAYVRQYGDDTIFCVANLSRSAQAAEIDLSPWNGRLPVEMLGQTAFPPIGELPYLVTLPPYGFFWFLLGEQQQSKAEIRTSHREFPTLVWTDSWNSLLQGRERRTLESDVLPQFLLERRWFAEKARGLPKTSLQFILPLEQNDLNAALAFVDAGDERHGAVRYLVPLKIRWTRFDRRQAPSPDAVAAIRRGAREGTLLDGAGDQELIAAALDAIREDSTIEQGERRLECRRTRAFREMAELAFDKVDVPQREQSNTTAIVDSACVVKLFRKVNPGIHPEVEIGRFLVEHTDFKNAPALLGSIELMENDARSALVVAHRFIENQGDAWTVTAAYLGRFIDDQRVLSASHPEESPELAPYLQRLRQIGRRTGELQTALASRVDIPDFAPEPISPGDIAAWTDHLLACSERVFGLLADALAKTRDGLADNELALITRLLKASDAIASSIRHALPPQIEAMKARHHGDFHLGQVLVAKDDAFILDFEGEPGRSLAERRLKAPAARDVAGMIRSIDYSTVTALANAANLTAEERNILHPKLTVWRDQATEAFWNACRQATDPALWPSDPALAQRLLDFFLLEKAFYEIEYELMNRPAWLHVPLEGTWRILTRQGAVQP